MELSTSNPKLIAGSAFLGLSITDVREWLDVLDELSVSTIDSAQFYGESEVLLGKSGALGRFIVDTKCSLPQGPTVATKDEVVRSGKESLEKLNTKTVDVYYMHCPERRTTIEDTFAGINELHKQGAFKRLGLSNYPAEDVEEVIRISQKRGWVLPSVYQGNYSAVSRCGEATLFPILRKHDISFYAYSPIAGGFLAKTRENVLTEGRLAGDSLTAKLYGTLYNKPSYLEALDTWGQIADEEGVSRAELAYRWVVNHSALRGDLGDAVVLGAKNVHQLRLNMSWVRKGKLSTEAINKIDTVWDSIKADAVLDAFNLG